MRVVLVLVLALAASACVTDAGARMCPVSDVDTCADLRGEMCSADPAQCISTLHPELARPFCVTGDAAGEAQNDHGDPDGDGFEVRGFVWYEVCP